MLSVVALHQRWLNLWLVYVQCETWCLPVEMKAFCSPPELTWLMTGQCVRARVCTCVCVCVLPFLLHLKDLFLYNH